MGKKDCCVVPNQTVCGIVSQPGAGNGGGDVPVTLISFPVTFERVKFGNPLLLKGGYVVIPTSGSPVISSGTLFSLGTFGTGITISNGAYTFTITEDDFVNFWVAVGLMNQATRTFTTGTSLQFVALFGTN
jgi:hypothetical protein